MLVCVCLAVTHQVSKEAADKLMNAKKEGRRGERGRQAPVLQQCRSEGEGVKGKTNIRKDRKQCRMKLAAWLAIRLGDKTIKI